MRLVVPLSAWSLLCWTLLASPDLVGSQPSADVSPGASDALTEKESVRRLAEQGEANAQWLLGHILLTESAPSTEEAMSWLRRAADRGHGLAQRDLGFLYEQGPGTRQDLEEAYFWYSLASLRDSGRASLRRLQLEQALSPEQRQAVQARVKGWRPQRQ
jgi:TPR repeat protein